MAFRVGPAQNLSGDPEKDFIGIGLAAELTVEFSRYQEIHVLTHGPEEDKRRASGSTPRFVIEGSFFQDSEVIKITVHLFDSKTGTQIWGDTFQSSNDAAHLIAFEEEVARIVAAKIACDRGFIARALSSESINKPPSELKTYEAILRYYEFDQTLTFESLLRAVEALEYAATVEPRCGQVFSMLGSLYGDGYSLELPGFETALEKAIVYAEKGVQINPDNQRARGILGFIRMFSNEIPAALAEAERAYKLNPNSLFMLDGIGFLWTLLGEWERGTSLINRVIQLNPYYNLYVHYALWADWIRQENYKQAHLETLNFRRPSVFWEPLMKAVTLGQLGRVEEGKRLVEDLLKLKPDFSSRGRVLIKHYMKFENIVEPMIEGLNKVGLSID